MEKEVIRDLQLAYNECAMLEGCINRLFITDSKKESKSFQNILTDFFVVFHCVQPLLFLEYQGLF